MDVFSELPARVPDDILTHDDPVEVVKRKTVFHPPNLTSSFRNTFNLVSFVRFYRYRNYNYITIAFRPSVGSDFLQVDFTSVESFIKLLPGFDMKHREASNIQLFGTRPVMDCEIILKLYF